MDFALLNGRRYIYEYIPLNETSEVDYTFKIEGIKLGMLEKVGNSWMAAASLSGAVGPKTVYGFHTRTAAARYLLALCKKSLQIQLKQQRIMNAKLP